MADSFTSDEQAVLSRFCSNLDKPVFVLLNLPEAVKGALFSRYSRSDKSLRRVLLDEFINKPEMGFKEIVGEATRSGIEQAVALRKAEEFYDRVLVGYGDDSVAELGGAHIACEDVSNIASKVLEDSRIGLSPLEKSTRYVYFNQKNADGNYRYYREPQIMASEHAALYERTCNLLFDTYSSLMEPVQKYVTDANPKPADATDRAYAATVRAKTCDLLRGLLPASALTNVGIFGNGRAFEYLLTKMHASPLGEMHSLAAEMQTELEKTIPSFVKRASPSNKYGASAHAYMRETRMAMEEASGQLLSNTKPENREAVELVDYDAKAEEKIIAAMLYPYSHLTLRQLRSSAAGMGQIARCKLIAEYYGMRQNRRNRPGRALENAYYTFDILGNYGMYRDLHRHRMLTQERQELSTLHGYDVPEELADAGVRDKFEACMQEADSAYREIAKEMPKQAQYVVPLAYKMRWYITLNLREVLHFTELRSSPQGHVDYRRVAQQMYAKVKQVHPALAGGIKFVDMSGGQKLERLEAEKKTDAKLNELDKKYGKGPN
ncbi:MAG: FAD-dependent thymidylate synthase [Candidatus Burarchaeum sp.]|nr:FAD-dependent thymidylate synthase [Candidatus Burarchaeum sp.]MDO8340322.1 FAD-dependent thymidylate synthase [Candidatus Burarchaeum sp.]